MNFGKLSKKYIQTNNIENNSNDIINELENNIIDNNENNEINNYLNKIIMNENNIKIKTENYEFHVIIEKIKYGEKYFTIYNKKGEYCIRIKIDNDLKNDVYLQYLNFYESCALNKSGTTEMLFAVLEYIKQQYGNDLKYFFEDDSKIHIDGITLNLSIIYIIIWGNVVYEKYKSYSC